MNEEKVDKILNMYEATPKYDDADGRLLILRKSNNNVGQVRLGNNRGTGGVTTGAIDYDTAEKLYYDIVNMIEDTIRSNKE